MTYIGGQFARDWGQLDAKEAIDNVALNLASVGATLEQLSGDDLDATLIISDWPSVDALEFFGLNRDDLDPWAELFRPVAENLNLQYEWSRDEDRITYRYFKR